MKKFKPNPNGGLPLEETSSAPTYTTQTSAGESRQPYDIEEACDAMQDFCDRRHEQDKGLIEALLALGFQIIIGGNRPSLPIANLPAHYAKAYAEVVGEAKNRDPVENVYRGWGQLYINTFPIFHTPPIDRDIETDGDGNVWIDGEKQ